MANLPGRLPLITAIAMAVAVSSIGFACVPPAPTAFPLQGAPDSIGTNTFDIDLTGAVEVPGPGDPDGSGEATILAFRNRVCWHIHVHDIDTAVAAHIHRAPAGVAGPIVVNLTPPDITTSDGCVTSDLVQDIVLHPENYYVNVHTHDFPAGAVRGQLD
jgi:CHRD domain